MKARLRYPFLCLLVLLTVSCATIQQYELELHRCYLVNSSAFYLEYTLFSIELKVMMYSGILPPRWACLGETWSGNPPWVHPMELPIGLYELNARYRFDMEATSAPPSPWYFYEIKLMEKDVADPKLIPYWEVLNPQRKIEPSSDGKKHDISMDSCDDKDHKCEKPCARIQAIIDYYLGIKTMKIESEQYSRMMEFIYWLDLDKGSHEAADKLKRHIGEMELLEGK